MRPVDSEASVEDGRLDKLRVGQVDSGTGGELDHWRFGHVESRSSGVGSVDSGSSGE